MVLVDLLPFVLLGLVPLGLPELADGAGEFGCHGVVPIAATHQILSQPALILFHCPISLSRVSCWPPPGFVPDGAIRPRFFCMPLMVVINGLGRDLARTGRQRGCRCQKTVTIVSQNNQLGGIVSNSGCPAVWPSDVWDGEQRRHLADPTREKPASLAGFMAEKKIRGGRWPGTFPSPRRAPCRRRWPTPGGWRWPSWRHPAPDRPATQGQSRRATGLPCQPAPRVPA